MVNGERLLKELYQGTYVPMPAMGFRTAKVDGSFRTLTKMTAIDTIIQRSFLDALSEACESQFSDSGYAYRRGRGQGAALKKYCELGTAYRLAAKVDPTDCYGSMDHQVLSSALERFFEIILWSVSSCASPLCRFWKTGRYASGTGGSHKAPLWVRCFAMCIFMRWTNTSNLWGQHSCGMRMISFYLPMTGRRWRKQRKRWANT